MAYFLLAKSLRDRKEISDYVILDYARSPPTYSIVFLLKVLM